MTGNFNYTGIFKSTFETRCIRLLIESYHSAIGDKSINRDWMENDITGMLNNYISKSPMRLKWKIANSREEYLFSESSPKEKGYADKESRIDMKLSTISSTMEFVYYFEAKNLREGNTALKRRYIDTGINNFIVGKYTNGILVGYLLDGNVTNTIVGINKLLDKDLRNDEILIKKENPHHDMYFESRHTSIEILKHLILDFTIQWSYL
jgi:hypothetical protein